MITNYGGGSDHKFSTRNILWKQITARFHSYNLDEGLAMVNLTKSILEELVKHEPCMPDGRTRILDTTGPFASEIASEVR